MEARTIAMVTNRNQLIRAKDRACSLPYIAETEALELVMRGRKGGRWWLLVRTGVREAESMLALDDKRRKR